MAKPVIYEQPLNERVRTFLRLEHLFCQMDYTLRGFSVWDSRATLHTLVDTLEILSRSDLKTELIKELERQIVKLTSLQQTPGVDTQQLAAILHKLETAQQALHNLSGQIGQSLREQELINSLRQRMTTPGGSCPIDLPIFHLWLQQPAEARIEQQEQWNNQLNVVREPVALLLGMIREASVPQKQLAAEGFYQQSLDSNQPIQLIRVAMPAELPYFAEISAGKHRLTIRFLEPQPGRRPLQAQDTVEFKLTCCAL
ncbi:MAG: cell division protein ZapD [Gammaproteobacteria bacterium]|nr:cell division protein ZapD [Gammaproteobacteria bacterium]